MGELSKPLNYLGMLTGAVSIASVFIPALAYLAILPNVVWTLWLGVALLWTKAFKREVTFMAQA